MWRLKLWLKSLLGIGRRLSGEVKTRDNTPIRALTYTRIHSIPVIKYVEVNHGEETLTEQAAASLASTMAPISARVVGGF